MSLKVHVQYTGDCETFRNVYGTRFENGLLHIILEKQTIVIYPNYVMWVRIEKMED